MRIPFLDLKLINSDLQDEINRAALSVISSGWYILGKAGESFEKNFKRSLAGEQEGFVLGCNSGTDAIILSLLASGVAHGDEVLTVSHTAIPTISAIVAVGARPIFVDIDPRTWVLDIHKVKAALTPRTKAVIPVQLYGNMVDMDALIMIAGQYGNGKISIIEDVAQAQGSAYSGQQAGSIGRFGAFSFYPSKNIGALGDGGAVFCRANEDMLHIRSLRNYGQKDRYNAEMPRGINSRLDEVQAAILDVKLKHLPEWNSKKSSLMRLYRSELDGLPVAFQEITPNCDPAWHLCVIALEDRSTRDALASYLIKEGIQTLIHYPIPTHQQKAFAAYSSVSLPITEDLSGRILSLPFHTSLLPGDIEYLLGKVRAYFH